MEKKSFSIALAKAGDFISQLTPLQFDLLGYPTIKTYSDYVEVCFTTGNTIRNFDVLKFDCSEFRMYADCSTIVVIYTFNAD